MNPIAISLITLVSAFFRTFGGRACRFHPSCSAYAQEAFRTLSFGPACWAALKRLSRCHPFSHGGHDPLWKKEPSSS